MDLGFSSAVYPLPGLCALSINHSNSYVAYPGSLTTGEIVLYDGHSLVSWQRARQPSPPAWPPGPGQVRGRLGRVG